MSTGPLAARRLGWGRVQACVRSSKKRSASGREQIVGVRCEATGGPSEDADSRLASSTETAPSTSGAAEPAAQKAAVKKGLRLRARLRLLGRSSAGRLVTAPARFVSQLPAVVEKKRLDKLRAEAEAAPEDVAKNDAYLAALVQKR